MSFSPFERPQRSCEMVSRSVEDATDDEQVARSLTGCVVGLFVFQIMDHVERASGKGAAFSLSYYLCIVL